MKALALKLLNVTVCLTLPGACLVINSNGNLATDVPLHEHPETKVMILDKKGKVLLESQTPAFATMRVNDEYLAKEKYSIVFQTPGYIGAAEKVSGAPDSRRPREDVCLYFDLRPT